MEAASPASILMSGPQLLPPGTLCCRGCSVVLTWARPRTALLSLEVVAPPGGKTRITVWFFCLFCKGEDLASGWLALALGPPVAAKLRIIFCPVDRCRRSGGLCNIHVTWEENSSHLLPEVRLGGVAAS